MNTVNHYTDFVTMNCSQATVSRILERGRKSAFVLDPPERPIRMSDYSPETTQTLAIALVSAYHEKYDLISVLWAAMDEAYEQGLKANEASAATSGERSENEIR